MVSGPRIPSKRTPSIESTANANPNLFTSIVGFRHSDKLYMQSKVVMGHQNIGPTRATLGTSDVYKLPCNNSLWFHCVSIGSLPVVGLDYSAIWRSGMDSDPRYAVAYGWPDGWVDGGLRG